MRETTIGLLVAAGAVATLVGTSSAQVTLFHQGFEVAPTAAVMTNNTLNVGGVLMGAGRQYAGTGNTDTAFTTLWVDTGQSLGDATGLPGPINIVPPNPPAHNGFGDSFDAIGTTAFTGFNSPNNYLPTSGGIHGFEFNDGDGLTKLQFQNLNTAGATSRSLELSYYVAATTWEPNDSFEIFISDGTTTLTALSVIGAAINGIEVFDLTPAIWTPLSFAIPDTFGSIFTVSIEVDHNSGSENMFVDEISILGIPTPGTMALLGMGGLLTGRRRRR